MPLSAVAAQSTVVCENPIQFEFRDGLVYINNPAGFLSVLRPHTFFASFHNAALCMQQCQEPIGAEIIPFPRPEEVASA